ncbi:hypothetical protein [Halarcobacter ebronensis]|uniref:CobQ/CobB/MinD/ParA nucleotide binding domain-containing protein n=1 Tax=Halarcobacter ebronensis TaxID=1462615 RepID=A0A4Q1AKL0_9BACT|nr:hypothetical protein [Halarcobacter ebronensis]QKF81509.1 hypothetical protein AEBR_1012 [Halarcobacter ebronensis]RXK05440.1 hypothetical protein CRV07_07970 [Halarcobacter ebronensis]
MNLIKINNKLLSALEGKFIIFTAGYKGGIGKSVIALGLAKEFDVPYITNDQGSAITGQAKFYNHTYLTYDFEFDNKINESKVVVVDLAGCFLIDKVILNLIKKSQLVILPTGENPYLDHTGCLISANNIYELNKNLMFITTGIEKEKIKDTVFNFNKVKSKYPDFERLKVYGLSKSNKIIFDSIAKRRSYIRTYLTYDEIEKEEHKTFIKDWSKIIKEIKSRIDSK